jgi:aspartate aminotransferase-like enzyme
MASSEFGTFYVPGPTEVRPEILATLSRPLIEHRGREFQAMFARIESGLRDALLTGRPVYVSTSSATGLMELGIRNTPPGRILSLVNGGFAERFAQVAESCEREVERLTVPYGVAHDLDAVERTLSEGKWTAVTVTHSETSTGGLNDVRAVGELAHRYGAIVLVDSVSGAGGAELMVDSWGLDFIFTGSQKAFALPPGLSFAVASADFVERARTVRDRGYYFDIVQFDQFAAKNETPSTPATSLLYALDAQLADIMREGIERRWERHVRMRDMTHAWVKRSAERLDLELGILATEGQRSPTVTVVTLPSNISGGDVCKGVAERGYTIGSGYGKLRNTTIRIGHMGDHTPERLARCLEVCEDAIAELASRRTPLRLSR